MPDCMVVSRTTRPRVQPPVPVQSWLIWSRRQNRADQSARDRSSSSSVGSKVGKHAIGDGSTEKSKVTQKMETYLPLVAIAGDAKTKTPSMQPIATKGVPLTTATKLAISATS